MSKCFWAHQLNQLCRFLYTTGTELTSNISSSADLTIYGGDFNTEPTSVPYRLLRAVSNLSDAWVENGDEAGKTSLRH